MLHLFLAILFTSLFFIAGGFALAFVYNNKENNRCLMCGLKSGKSCIKNQCIKKPNINHKSV